MYQNYACQKFTSLLTPKSNLLKVCRFNYIWQSHRLPKNVQSISTVHLNINKLKKTLLKHQLEIKRYKSTKVKEAVNSAKDDDVNIITTKNKPKTSLNIVNNLRIWGAAGVVTYLASYIVRNVVYAFAAIPLMLNYKSMKLLYSTFKRDMIFAQRYMRARIVDCIIATQNKSLCECFDAIAHLNSTEVMIYFDNTRWTYKQIGILTNKITNSFLNLDYEKGDVIAIMVTNRPEYVALILGLAKIGVIAALINPTFKEDILLHAIQISDCKGLIISEDLFNDFNKIKNQIDSEVQIFQMDGLLASKGYINLSDALISASLDPPEVIQKISQKDPLLYIYTSTSTGLPKAAVLTHSKFIENSIGITYLLNLGFNDIIYNPLPLYHTTGLVAGVGPSIICGIPVVIRRKFSAVKYWADCKKYKCTVGQYVGDICRYLLLQPQTENDKTHNLKQMLGSGMNRTVLKQFSDRFNVQITEVPEAFDGHGSIINLSNKAGAIGLVPSFLSEFMQPVSLVAVNHNSIESISNDKSYKINTISVIHRFDESEAAISMLNPIQEEEKKTFINPVVYKKADKLYITGNILAVDELGHMYFMGRSEDYFVWKGITVAALELESVISHLTTQSPYVIYGVLLPEEIKQTETATITDLQNKINLKQFSEELSYHIHHYACPVFVRLKNEMQELSTLRIDTKLLSHEGLNPLVINKDKLYYINEKSDLYEPLMKNICTNIVNKKILF